MAIRLVQLLAKARRVHHPSIITYGYRASVLKCSSKLLHNQKFTRITNTITVLFRLVVHFLNIRVVTDQ